MSDAYYAVILAGGKGERFWPLSTSKKPKQLLSLVGDRPLLVQAVERLEGLIPPERVLVITNADLVAATREAAPILPAENVIGEPVGRDTAAAVALGCALVAARDPNASFCVLTADHIIGDVEHFQNTLRRSLEIASSEDVLLTIGIQPDEPSTGYGYIEAGEPYRESDGITFLNAKRFVEKPTLDKAREYVDRGTFYWNSGMFIWSAKTLANAFKTYRPALHEMMERLAPAIGTEKFQKAFEKEYEQLEKISIDYAIMEKADNIVMAKGTFSWDDVGSWPSLANHFDSDPGGNVLVGDCQQIDAQNSIVVSKDHITALVGVDDLIVVQADGVTLVCKKDRAQDVKRLVEQLRSAGRYQEVL